MLLEPFKERTVNVISKPSDLVWVITEVKLDSPDILYEVPEGLRVCGNISLSVKPTVKGAQCSPNITFCYVVPFNFHIENTVTVGSIRLHQTMQARQTRHSIPFSFKMMYSTG